MGQQNLVPAQGSFPEEAENRIGSGLTFTNQLLLSGLIKEMVVMKLIEWYTQLLLCSEATTANLEAGERIF